MVHRLPRLPLVRQADCQGCQTFSEKTGCKQNTTYELYNVYTAISINVVGSKHKAKRQDRKFTWDFYE